MGFLRKYASVIYDVINEKLLERREDGLKGGVSRKKRRKIEDAAVEIDRPPFPHFQLQLLKSGFFLRATSDFVIQFLMRFAVLNDFSRLSIQGHRKLGKGLFPFHKMEHS
ncbi:hypothetical protein TNCV_3339631 [Trichonephila clavipes]|nr:hypothetical protein TNCV_3339631 [Trichonephila clavipes]